MAGEEGAREEQMSVRDLKLDTKDDEGGEGEAQRQKRLSDKATEAQMAKKKKTNGEKGAQVRIQTPCQ